MFAVETHDLSKEYPVGFWRRRRHPALRGLNLCVEQGETFGLLGPNGAGKSTTLKILLGLIFPTSGTARVAGRDLHDSSVRARIGYLPGNPYFYDHLTGGEFLNYAGQLFGLRGSDLRRRATGLLERVGLADSPDVQLRKFSKGMVQRLGIAQALINDPDLVLLDEPMSGLDPLGRREVRDLILGLRSAGKTVLFSTHILSDAEALCDRVAILHRGRLEGCGELRQILSMGASATEILLENPAPGVLEQLSQYAQSIVRTGDRVRLEVAVERDVRRCLEIALKRGEKILAVTPVKTSLEDYFMSQVDNPAVPTGDPESGKRKPEAGNSGRCLVDSRAESPKPRCRQETARASSFELRDGRSSASWFSFSNSLRRIAAITVHAFKESVRDNVLYTLTAFALLLSGAAILFGSISVGIEQIVLVNLSLSSISAFGLAIAIFIGVGLVSKEIEKRSIHNILSKPVRRMEFILGKYFGLVLTLMVNTALMTAGLYVAIFCQKPTFSRGDLAPLGAVYLITLELALVVGLALLFSCISTPVLSAVYTLALFVVGNFLSDVRWFGQESGNALLQRTTEFLYYLLPNFTSFNVIASVAHGEQVPRYLLVANSSYALLYSAILLSATILVFEEREFR
jgi:ABC-2 type transport system ATP-binding protein